MYYKIVTWNENRRPTAGPLPLHDNTHYDIIAVQEPAIGARNRDIARNSQRFHTFWGFGRAALHVSKRFSQADIEVVALEKDYVSVSVGGVVFTSIYSPIRRSPDWRSPLHELLGKEPNERNVVMGDMNLHHPMWDLFDRTSTGAEVLLDLAERWDLTLATPRGEPTRTQPGVLDSTIDHIWHSLGMRVRFEGAEAWSSSDHIPQVATVIMQGESDTSDGPARFNWKMLDCDLAATLANDLTFDDVTTPEQLEAETARLVAQLETIAKATTPMSRPGTGKGVAWWTAEVARLAREAKAATKAYRRTHQERELRIMNRANHARDRAIARSKRACWRQGMAEISKDASKTFRMAKWARTYSFQPREPAVVPQLNTPNGPATTHEEKAEAFARRFFPGPATTAPPRFIGPGKPFEIDCSLEEVRESLRTMAPWKAAGSDQLPVGFLRACGEPLIKCIHKLASASFRLGYYPAAFRNANVVVIPKPGKTVQQRQEAGGWRPISLLSCLGKVLESIVTRKLTRYAEANGLLPDGQMGNRSGRSTQVAAKIVVDAVREIWEAKLDPSFLQLDLKAAFDSVDHEWLLYTLQTKGIFGAMLDWIDSFLRDRNAQLFFDGRYSRVFSIQAGVPQGSPLSPILFVLFASTLYDRLAQVSGLMVVGFADDTNLLSCGRTTDISCERLEQGWKVCEEWAKERCMSFEPAKSELLHFSRARNAPANTVNLSGTVLRPVEGARFLGIWLDRKLTFKPHVKKVKAKCEVQTFALTKITSKTWGLGFSRARQVYLTVIRSMIAYGSAVWHTPTPMGGRPRGPVQSLVPVQNACLRVVTGAFKATPIASLELESHVPPLDLHLTKLGAKFEKSLQSNDRLTNIRALPAALVAHSRQVDFRRHRQYRRQQNPRRRTDWVDTWCHGLSPDKALMDEWSRRCAATGRAPKKWRDIRNFHERLSRSESSLWMQTVTGKIGLRRFLFDRNVPDIDSPVCRCGQADETVSHIVLDCPLVPPESRVGLPTLRTSRDFWNAMHDADQAKPILRWLIDSGRLSQYSLASSLVT